MSYEAPAVRLIGNVAELTLTGYITPNVSVTVTTRPQGSEGNDS